MLQEEISERLEDYLEAIWEILRTSRVARVRNIAEAMGVRPATVTTAMKRLAQLGLISYAKREYIELTDSGRELAMSTKARHRLLARFFKDVLGVDCETAQRDACLMEHHLSVECMEKLTGFVEKLTLCPVPLHSVISRITECSSARTDSKVICPLAGTTEPPSAHAAPLRILSDLDTDETATVIQVLDNTGMRMNLLEMGFLPGSEIRLIRKGSHDSPCAVLLDGYEVEIPKPDSSCIVTGEA
jgi:DtxR family Mn-dependent transcriptional regulator